MMNVLPLFQWFDSTYIGAEIRSSSWQFPLIEVVHLFGLTVLLGSIVAVDMRLFGIGLRRQPVTRVARELRPITLIGLVTSAVTGILLFLSEALKCYGNQAFWFKMAFLGGALLFYFTIHQKVTSSDKSGYIVRSATAALSLILWFGVGVGGRAIGFI